MNGCVSALVRVGGVVRVWGGEADTDEGQYELLYLAILLPI